MLSPIRAKIQGVLKLLLFMASLCYLWYKLSVSDLLALGLLLDAILANSSALLQLVLVLVLMLFNWGIESLKWRLLIRDLENISFKDAFSGVLAGVSLSIFTPNRSGEFAGKIFNLQVAGRANAIIRSMIGSISQVLITFCAGLPVLIWYLNLHQPEHTSIALDVLVYCLMLTFVILYFKIPVVARKWEKWNFIQALIPYELQAVELNFKLLLSSFLLSAVRFLIFTFQYFLLLRISGCAASHELLLGLIVLYFFLVSLIPTFALSELGVRGSVALTIFAPFGMNNSVILASSLLLWLINLAIPALFGSFLIYRLRFFRNDGK